MWPHEGGGAGSSGNVDGIPLSPTKSPHGSPRKHFFNVPTGGGSPRFTTYHPCICIYIHTYIHTYMKTEDILLLTMIYICIYVCMIEVHPAVRVMQATLPLPSATPT